MSSEVAENTEFESENDDDARIIMMRKKQHKFGEVDGLNLTAMMDMMTILLVFLIKQYASAPENIPVSEDMRPPASTTKDNIVPSVAVTVTKTSVLLEGKLILQFKGGEAVTVAGDAEPWKALESAMANRVNTIEALANRGGAAFDGNLMVVADEDTPYDTIWKVLYAAGQSKFTTYRMVLRAK